MADTPPIISGRTDAMPQPTQRTWDPTNGMQISVPYAGTADAIRSQFNSLVGVVGIDKLAENINGISGTLRMTVVGSSGGPGDGNANLFVWEVEPQDILKPIETHPDFWNITAAEKTAILKAARNGDPLPGYLQDDDQQELYAYYAHQFLDFPVTDIFVRCSQTLSIRSDVQANYDNINRVVPLTAINPPVVLLGALSDLPYYDGGHGPWEWMKKAPRIRQIARSKFQLAYVWQGAEKWAKIYGGSWDPTVE